MAIWNISIMIHFLFTYRSAKHSQSTAETSSFGKVMRTNENIAKPVLVIIADGGPDEYPRYQKVSPVMLQEGVRLIA